MLLEPVQVTREGLRAELRYAAPVSSVFDFVSDLRNMVVWWPEHPVYRRLRGDGGAGSLYAWVYVLGVLPAVGFTRVVAREPGERFAYRAGFPGLPIRVEYRFSADADG